MNGKFRSSKVVVPLSLTALFYCFSPCYGESREEIFDRVLSGYTKSLQKLEHVSFSYQWEETVDGMSRDKRAGRIFFDQKNIRDEFVETRFGDKQDAQYETVIAPEWDRFIRVARSEQLEPTIFSCLNAENIPGIHRILGATSLLFGWALFQGEHVFLPVVLRRLGPNSVTISESDQNQIEIRFVYQGSRCRMLFDADFALRLFESACSHLYEVQEFQNISGVVFPAKFVSTSQISLSKVTYTYSLSDVSFSPLSENDFRFSMTLPNGTAVSMQDARHIQYIWWDGKIVPKTSEAMMEIAMGDHKFVPGPDEPRYWMMAIGILMILAALGKMLYDAIWKSKRGGR